HLGDFIHRVWNSFPFSRVYKDRTADRRWRSDAAWFKLDSHTSEKHGGAGRAGEGAPSSSIESRIRAHGCGLGVCLGEWNCTYKE
ncbi:unnamed protein product, partial [Urochloa humidicola]